MVLRVLPPSCPLKPFKIFLYTVVMNIKYTLVLQEGFDCGPVLAVMTTLLTVAFQEVGMIIVNLYLFHGS